MNRPSLQNKTPLLKQNKLEEGNPPVESCRHHGFDTVLSSFPVQHRRGSQFCGLALQSSSDIRRDGRRTLGVRGLYVATRSGIMPRRDLKLFLLIGTITGMLVLAVTGATNLVSKLIRSHRAKVLRL